MKRRNFLQKASLSTIGVVASASVVACNTDKEKNNSGRIVNSTSVETHSNRYVECTKCNSQSMGGFA